MKGSKSLRVIIDTNLWISFIISNKLTNLDLFLTNHQIKLLFSRELALEIIETSSKDKLKKYLNKKIVKDMFVVFDPFMEFVEVTSSLQICRDPKDDFLLNLAKDGNADYLLTGDKDLLSLTHIEQTKIITISEFFKEFE